MDFTTVVDGIVHEPTQTEGRGLDLTISAVYELTDPGRVDFGGGELEDATTIPHDSVERNADDDYEWWHLDAGQYLVEYNESLSDELETAVTLQTRTELLERGASHPTLVVTELPRVPLSVGGEGIRIKENARVSTIVSSHLE